VRVRKRVGVVQTDTGGKEEPDSAGSRQSRVVRSAIWSLASASSHRLRAMRNLHSAMIVSNRPTEWMLRTVLRAWLPLPTRGSAVTPGTSPSLRCPLAAGFCTTVRAGATPDSGPPARPNESEVAPARTARSGRFNVTAGLIENAHLVALARESGSDSSTESVHESGTSTTTTSRSSQDGHNRQRDPSFRIAGRSGDSRPPAMMFRNSMEVC